MSCLEFRQVDVFAETPLSGNGLAAVVTDVPLDGPFMQRLTSEFRQFETIFLSPGESSAAFQARVFTMEEEVPFAGHPALGATAVLHERAGGAAFACELSFPAGRMRLESERTRRGYRVTMHQRPPSFGAVIEAVEEGPWLEALGLEARHRDPVLPICVVSTGLPYLIVPVTHDGLHRTRITLPDFEKRLGSVGAKFVYVFDVANREGRTWDNAGLVEDVATGSAAGPVAGLLVSRGLAAPGETIVVRQGGFLGRPSEMKLRVVSGEVGIEDILLSGHVCMIASGRLDASVTP